MRQKTLTLSAVLLLSIGTVNASTFSGSGKILSTYSQTGTLSGANVGDVVNFDFTVTPIHVGEGQGPGYSFSNLPAAPAALSVPSTAKMFDAYPAGFEFITEFIENSNGTPYLVTESLLSTADSSGNRMFSVRVLQLYGGSTSLNAVTTNTFDWLNLAVFQNGIYQDYAYLLGPSGQFQQYQYFDQIYFSVSSAQVKTDLSASVPEPASITLLASGLLGFAASRRKSTQA